MKVAGPFKARNDANKGYGRRGATGCPSAGGRKPWHPATPRRSCLGGNAVPWVKTHGYLRSSLRDGVNRPDEYSPLASRNSFPNRGAMPVNCQGYAFQRRSRGSMCQGYGVRSQLCAAPAGPFRQLTPDPLTRPPNVRSRGAAAAIPRCRRSAAPIGLVATNPWVKTHG